MRIASLYRLLTATVFGAATVMTAQAAEPLKIGLVLPMSGQFATYGKEISNGIKLYLAKNGDTVAGRKVELIIKDDAPGTAGDVSKRLAQELLVKDKVDILAGFALTPSAAAVAPLATEAKKPMVIMNAATSALTTRSPNIVRTSFTLPQNTAPIAIWAAKNGIRKAYTVVVDYSPGHDSEAQFTKTFTAGGGEVIGGVRVPIKTTDFSPYLEKIKEAKPDAVFIFVPAGELAVSFMKGFQERGLGKVGIKIIGPGDLTDEESLDAIGDAAVGIINSFHYAPGHKSPENKAFTEAYSKAYPGDRVNFMAVGGYDGMHLISEVLKKTGGNTDPDKFVEAARGMKWVSPRGPVFIDPATRDIVQTIYIRKVEKVNGKLQNVEFDQIAEFKDPGK
ncbi:MAG: ABC transporter substrate-binding protein [Zoogloea sp.]|uniref:ABC transporter substrate-binding protein n=1 Tax=Zoogloea sp. TaxID=49181 RepID=UPI003F31C098